MPSRLTPSPPIESWSGNLPGGRPETAVAQTRLLYAVKRLGFFVNHDLAGYEVPVHADIPHQEVTFLDETDPMSSPMKAKGVAELGICGVAAAVANAIYNATGVRVRDYPAPNEPYVRL